MAAPLFCSFCGKAEREVVALVAGPGHVFICNECVDVSVDAVAFAIRRAASLKAMGAARVLLDAADTLGETQRDATGKADLLRSIDRRLERTNDLLERIAATIDRISNRQVA